MIYTYCVYREYDISENVSQDMRSNWINWLIFDLSNERQPLNPSLTAAKDLW